MSININSLIPTKSGTLNTGFVGAELAGLCLTTNPLMTTTYPVLAFETVEMVSAFFGNNSDEANYSKFYFNSYVNAIDQPNFLLFGLYINSNLAPYLRGGVVTATVAQFQQIVAGGMTLSFDGKPVTLSGMDFSNCNSYSDVAAIIQTALIAAIKTAGLNPTCVYSAQTGAFQISNGDVSGTGTCDIFPAESILVDAMMLMQNQGAVISQGSISLTPGQNMDNLKNFTSNWIAFTNLCPVDVSGQITNTLLLCAWANNQNNGYAYVPYVIEQVVGNTIPNTTALINAINNADYANIIPVFGGNPGSNNANLPTPISPGITTLQGLDQAMFVLGVGASINYDGRNSTISFAWKQQSGLSYTVNDDLTAQALITAGVNFYGNYGSRANTYRFFQQGVITGQFKWIHNFYNQVWLSSTLQDSIATLFENSPKIENAQDGYDLLDVQMTDVMEIAITNGVAQTNNVFDASQAAILSRQLGQNIAPILTAKGYFIQIVPATPAQRAAGTPPRVTVVYTNGGAIVTLPLNMLYVF
jgi:hypothetical protein